jgi:hypothetical protein
MNAFRWPQRGAKAGSRSAVMFPNRSRSLGSVRARVTFWGYASTVELTFQLDTRRLQSMAGVHLLDDASFLQAFDANRELIEGAASQAYARHRVTFCRLDSADFPM